MKLLSPTGVRVSVSDESGELLLGQGFKRIEEPAEKPASPSVTPTPRKRTRKTTEE